MPAPPQSRSPQPFTIKPDDLDFITNLLLEQERPLSTLALARRLVSERLEAERHALQERFSNARFYNPAEACATGDTLTFPALDFATGEVVGQRPGNHPGLGPFTVISVDFEGNGRTREFATELRVPHLLSRDTGDDACDQLGPATTVDEVMAQEEAEILDALQRMLFAAGNLVRLKDEWFLRELLLEVSESHLNLAEAVLDVYGGGPFPTGEILEQIGGLAGTPALHEFSMNHALLHDERFDEVGPTGAVLWFLRRMEPAEVQQTPLPLRFSGIEHDRSLLDDDMLDLEAEIDDELSPLRYAGDEISGAVVTLIYPHRRLGTLPLNARLRTFFPTARQSERVYVTLVDARDGEQYPGWIVRAERFVCGLGNFYRKYALPVGARVEVSRDEKMGHILLDPGHHRQRAEWVRLITPQDGHLAFQEARRAIGANHDELMVFGAEEPEAVDALFELTLRQRRPLLHSINSALRALLPLSSQGAVHLKTLYSALNVIRRCPPGPLMAALVAGPDYVHVGDHYWRPVRKGQT